jgi:hypothetical protein
MIKLKSILMLALVSGISFFSSCDVEPPLPDNFAQFEADQLGFSPSEAELTLNLKLTREADIEGEITVMIETTLVAYDVDFTTDPAATSNSLKIAVPTGAAEVTFKLKKVDGVLFDGDEKIKFVISDATGLFVGEQNELTVSFSEIVASAGQLEVTGGGATYPNKVFIDLSANRQSAISRTAWDLGFFSGDDFRVVLNASNGMMARALTKTDMAAVTAADTVGFGAQLSLAAVFAVANATPPGAALPAWAAGAVNWIDDPTGDLTKTAIAQVSATAADNKVYIINRGNGPGATSQPALGWKKIRILRTGSNYTLQHADINAATFTEVQIVKNTTHRFQYIHFSAGAVTIEPAKEKWDIAWAGFTNATNFGSGAIPYYFQDVILQNTAGVQTVQILEATIAYDAFAESHLAAQTLSSLQLTVGTNWRSGGGPTSGPALRTDRYYIIKDPEGNYYKLKFTALTTNGERGKPQFKYALVKKKS